MSTNTAYERIRPKTRKKGITKLLKREETYFVGATIPAILFAGFIDGGVCMALAYGARKLYEAHNG